MYTMKTFIISTILCLNTLTHAVPVFSTSTIYHNANGSFFSATAKGDEYLSFLQAEDGTIISFDSASGNYMIAQYDAVNNRIIPSAVNFPLSPQTSINSGLMFSAPAVKSTVITINNLKSIYKSNYDILNSPVFDKNGKRINYR